MSNNDRNYDGGPVIKYVNMTRNQTAPQVFSATHYYKKEPVDKETGSEYDFILTPYSYPDYKRSFISFSYGGLKIEDFDLIAYCDGNTMDRAGSADFEDLTSSYDILDGESYHGTHFKPFQLSLSLATDGITQKQLDRFKSWFRGGVTRELVLAEHPNRYICARLQSPPQFHLIPFELPIAIPSLGEEQYKGSSTLYKGTINLTFISSDPFWRAYGHLVGQWGSENQFLEKWRGKDLNAAENIEIRKEVTKIIYEDNIPLPSMIASDMRLSFGQTGSEIAIGKSTQAAYVPTQTRGITITSASNRASSNLRKDQLNVLTVEEFHRPIALPEGSGIFERYDTIVAIPKDVEKDGEAQTSVAGEFKWWWPWGTEDSIDAAVAADPDKSEQISLRGARVMASSTVEMDDDGYLIKCFVASNSKIVDAYDYPQLLASGAEVEIVEDEEDEEDTRSVQTRGLIKGGTSDETVTKDKEYYFFYGGTAPTPATISFDLPLTFYETKALGDKRRITSIASSSNPVKVRDSSGKKVEKTYSTIRVDGTYTKEISMTMPNIMTSYNKVIKIISEASEKSIIDLQEKIRDEIRHPYVRAYALKSLAALVEYKDQDHTGSYVYIPANDNIGGEKHNPSAASGEPDRRVWADMMQSFWVNNDTDKLIKIIIDSNTSKATGTFKFRINPTFTIVKTVDPNNQYWLTFENGNVDKILEVTEDIGDAMRTSWYYIDDRNEFKEIYNEKGYLSGYSVQKWADTDEITRQYSHKVTIDFPVSLKNFYIDYEYMYL